MSADTIVFPSKHAELLILGSKDSWVAPERCEIIHAGRVKFEHAVVVRYDDGREMVIVFDYVEPMIKLKDTD